MLNFVNFRSVRRFSYRLSFLSIALLFSITASAQNVPDTLEQRLKACTSCHGAQGRAGTDGYYPRIAGKPEGYLFNQLKNFRDGKRTFPMMTYMVANMSDDYLHEIATFFSNLHPPYAAPQKPYIQPGLLERGRQLVLHGDEQKKIPACIGCHGQKLTGLAPFVPGIAGLPRDYLIAQLGAWQTGSRHAAVPDCMQSIAKKLRPEDIGALSGWLAMQYVADDGIAEAFSGKVKGHFPLACGSIPGS
ncbi:c-type cytochrome [Undibacterium sp. Dicai25W]|uniref:c-type cytochrome n=1 Tax=Undibacterium sp. Dicai25W TaxID=3413034 RepID=UPI003BF118E9